MAKNTDELFEPYRRSVLAGQKRLTGAGEERRLPLFGWSESGSCSGQVDGDQGRDGGGSSRARAEERWHEEEDGEEVTESPSGWPIYKARS